MHRRLTILAATIAAFALAACGAEAPDPDLADEDIGSVDSALLADCSTDLGNCYIACQNTPPTPTTGCFTSCERVFRGCIGLPELEMSQQ